MHIHTYRPQKLPLKHLQWQKLLFLIGKTRDALARFDEQLQKTPHLSNFIDPLCWQESLFSLHTQNYKSDLHNLTSFRLAKTVTKLDEAFFQNVSDAKKALDIAMHWKKQDKLGNRFFCLMHKTIKSHSPKNSEIGKFRNRQNWIGPEGCKIEQAYFYPPRASQVRPLMANLEAYLALNEEEPLTQLAIAFAQLLIIHPFMDGNGRIARLMIPLFLYRKGIISAPILFMSEYFQHTRQKYLKNLNALSEKESWEVWIDYFLRGILIQIEKTKKRISAK